MRVAAEERTWLAPHDEAALRWALSLARLSAVPVGAPDGDVDLVELGHSSDKYRTKLFNLLSPCVVDGRVNRESLRTQLSAVRTLVRDERDRLLRLFGQRLPAAALDRATRRRPLALSLSGGGGTAYVFVGAVAVLEDAELHPDVITGTSMGSILGAFRARDQNFQLASVKTLMKRVTWRRVFSLQGSGSRFGLPATLKLSLREVIGHEFERDGRFMTLADMAIPFRVCIAGITQGPSQEEEDRYAHLLDAEVKDIRRLRRDKIKIARVLGELAKKPVRPIYLGGDDLTREFDVLDAIGFSSAVPGVIHYDIVRDDPRMVAMVEELVRREGVFRLVDGGLADNLPTRAAWDAVQSGAIARRDPFVLALDSFAPKLTTRHLLFLPLMRLAETSTREGKEFAHLTVDFKNVLSPLSVVPTQDEFLRAIDHGREEIRPHLSVIRKMVGPIPDPPGVLSERDGS